MQIFSLTRVIITAAFGCGLAWASAIPAPAQDEDQGPPAREVGGGLIDQIGAPFIARELGLSEDQQKRIDSLLQSVREYGRTAVAPPDNGGEPLSEEQKQQYRAELDQALAVENAEAVKRLRTILDDRQFTRLRQIWLQQIGLEGILQADVAAELGLSEEQRAKFATMREEEMERNRSIPAVRNPEDEQTFRDEWKQKWTAELTEEQRGKWTQILGPPLVLAQAAPGEGPGPATTAPRASRTSRDSEAERPAVETPAETENPLAPTGPVVASFDRDGQTGEVRTGDPVKFNFEYAPWPLVLKLFADRAGYILHLKETPPGTYTYRDPKSYTITDALDVLNGYLLQEGYVLVRRDNALVSLRVDGEDIPPNLIPEVTPAELVERGRNELVSVIFPLQPGVDVEALRDEINEITGPQGNAVALTTASGLYVTDTAGNLRRIYDIIKSVAPPAGPEDLAFRAYALTYLAADEAEQIVGTMLGSTRTVPNVSAGGGGDGDRERRGFSGFPPWAQQGGDQGRGDRDRQRGSSTSTTTAQAKVTAELRTNQLLVSATPAQHKVVEELVKAIDVDTTGQPMRVGSRKPYLQVYKLSSDARETSKTLSALMPDVVVNESGDDHTVHIYGTEAQHRQVQEYLRQLEGGGGAQTVTVIPLSSKDPLSVASILKTVFAKDGTSAPTIEPNLQERQLIVRGTSDQILQIRTILSNMGEDGTGVRSRSNNSRFVQLPLSGHNADELLDALRRAWPSTNRGPLQVIPRSDSGLIRGIRTPENRNGRDRVQEAPATRPQPEATSTEPAPAARHDSAGIRDVRSKLFDVALEEPTSASEQKDAAAPPAASAASTAVDANEEEAPDAPGAAQPPLTIAIQGDQLLIIGDPSAMEEATSIIDELMSVMPVRNSWTIFTLQSGSADEVSNMLKLLLPDVTVSSATPTTSSTSFFGGISGSLNSLGSGLADMTGLSTLGSTASLTIIPDSRLNSLFVSGPESRILEVEQLLDVLDASEWSAGALRERRPRTISVKHAEVVDVYERVSEIYANYLETGRNGGGRNQQNPFQMLVGGGRGGGGGGGNQDNEVKLTISADTRTNDLIVSANDSLFNEIKTMVEEMDQRAFEAKRTVRIVALQHASPNLVKNAVTTLMPKVTVSRTGGGNNNVNNYGQQFGNPGFRGFDNDNQGGPSGDDMRRMMEFRERMRQQQQQQFGGATQATGGPNFGGGDNGGRFGGFRGFGGGGPGGFGGFGGGDFGGRGGDRGRGDRGRN